MPWAYCKDCGTLHGHHGDAKAIECKHPVDKQLACEKCIGYPKASHAEWCREGPLQDRIEKLEARHDEVKKLLKECEIELDFVNSGGSPSLQRKVDHILGTLSRMRAMLGRK